MKELTEGDLWSWVRSVMSRGADIRCDYDQACTGGMKRTAPDSTPQRQIGHKNCGRALSRLTLH